MSEKSPKQLLQEKRDFWQQHVLSCQESELTSGEYCCQHNLKKSRFYYWRRRIKPVLPVALIQLPVQDSGLRLIINNRYQVEIDERFSPDTLQHLLQVLEGR
jgi:hypothetical protein